MDFFLFAGGKPCVEEDDTKECEQDEQGGGIMEQAAVGKQWNQDDDCK